MAFSCSIVFGRTGFLGRPMVERLVAEGNEVRAASGHLAGIGLALHDRDTAPMTEREDMG